MTEKGLKIDQNLVRSNGRRKLMKSGSKSNTRMIGKMGKKRSKKIMKKNQLAE